MTDLTPRSLILFEESCRSKVTRYVYRKNLDEFLNWAHKDYDSLLLMPQKDLEELLQDYLIYRKRRVSPNSLQVPFSAIFKFLDVNGIEYNRKKIKMLFPQRVKAGGERAITDQELRELIRVAPTKKSLALIHILSATGCRPEGIAELKLKHISDMPQGFKALVIYAGSLNEMITFLHPEAVKALDDYLYYRKEKGEKLTDESYLLAPTSYKAKIRNKPMSTSVITRIMTGVIRKADIKRVRSTSKRYDLASCTGLRKRFNTKLKKNPNISYAIAEKLMDHKIRLEGHYMKPDINELFGEYKKAVSDLMIDDSKIKELKIQQLEQEKTELEELKDKEKFSKGILSTLLSNDEWKKIFYEALEEMHKNQDEFYSNYRKNENCEWEKIEKKSE